MDLESQVGPKLGGKTEPRQAKTSQEKGSEGKGKEEEGKGLEGKGVEKWPGGDLSGGGEGFTPPLGEDPPLDPRPPVGKPRRHFF